MKEEQLPPSYLVKVSVDLVAILHLQHLRSVIMSNALSIDSEAEHF
eukprot:CAMPEP_0170395126 /NCGR_PEP_ID=MMETSP0117_2-20130122/21613_1 /TAXON_ID=400756 /ORGANISM="Durinskia baltica, Strain CSIRO CS-38" /LENGTH=45 /DNA_ID= /DNA_START= /DNA_END= /DNA_ORIENTATION=